MSRRWNVLAWSIFAAVFLGMSIYLILNPTRTGVVPNYRMASTKWWDGEGMYGVGGPDSQGTHGFLYFPQFAVCFSPFNIVRPEILGEILWRAVGFGLFGWGLWRLAQPHRPSQPSDQPGCFLPLVLLAVPASLASLNNGQTNLPLSACLVLAVLSLRRSAWWETTFWLSLGLILKPIALAPFLLALAIIPAMRKPLGMALLPLAILGFLHPDWHYAAERWVKCFEKIVVSYSPENLRVSDLFGALGKTGLQAPPAVEKGTRAFACLVALAWGWRAFRRQGSEGAAWALWVATALVYTLFNPRAETNSYVLISPVLAYAAISYWREGPGERWKGWVLAAACFGLMCDGMGRPIYKATDVWFKPLAVLLVSPLLFRMPNLWKVERDKREEHAALSSG
jgi:hypothetical protein